MTKENQTKKDNLEVVAVNTTQNEECRTFVMHNEDHTLGNSLRYIVMKSPDTEFCGYSVPHPSENKINFRIQTRGPPARDSLRKGLSDLSDVCEHTLSVFQKAVSDFKSSQTEEPMDT